MDDAFSPDERSFDPSVGLMGQVNPMAALQASNLFPRFYMRPIKNEAKSAEAGIDIYDEHEYCTIHIRGDSLQVNDVPVKRLNAEQRQLFKPVYDHWKRTHEQKPREGTPLEMVPWINTAMALTLKGINIFTLQDLAGIAETAIQRLPMGGQELVQRARNHVKVATDQAFVGQLTEADRQQKARIEVLEKDNQDLKMRMDELVRQLGIEDVKPRKKA